MHLQTDTYYGYSLLFLNDFSTEYMRGYPNDVYIVTSALSDDVNQRDVSNLWQYIWQLFYVKAG